MGEESGGNVLMGLIPGFGQGYQQGQETKRRNEFLAAQADLIRQEAKLKEKTLVMESLKSDIFGKMSPDQQMAALFPKAEGAEMFQRMLESLGGGGGAAPAAPPAPFGGGTPSFPLDPSLSAAPSFSQQAASLLAPKPEFTFDSTGKIIVKMNEPKTRRRDTVGPDGVPVSILETEEGKGIPGGALPVYQAPVFKQILVGPNTYEYAADATGRPIHPNPQGGVPLDARLTGQVQPQLVETWDPAKKAFVKTWQRPPGMGGAAGLPGSPAPSPRGAGGGGGAVSKPGPADTPVDETNARMYRMPDGSMPAIGMTPAEIKASGGKLISSQTAEVEGATKVVRGLVDQLEQYSFGKGGIFTGVTSGMFGRGGQAAQDKFAQYTQAGGRGEKIALYEGYRGAFAGAMARTVMFERGVLTQPDIDRAMKALPIIFPLPDTEAVAREKFGIIKKFINALGDSSDRKSLDAALTKLESSVKRLGGKPPSLDTSIPKTWLDYKRTAGGQ